jgi:hypothetical protein
MDQEYLQRNGVSKADWEKTPDSVKCLVEKLVPRVEGMEQQLRSLQSQVERMQEQLKRHSGNSSKPPSSDIGKIERKTQKSKKGKKRGGQPGHPGFGRILYAVEACESVEDYYPQRCWHCGENLTPQADAPERHQVVEMPPIAPQVREYRLHECQCEACGSLTRANLPDGVTHKGYGARVVATVAVLNGMYRLPQRWIQQALKDLFRIEISLGSINGMRHEASAAIAQAVTEAQEYVQGACVVNADETGFRQGNADGHNPQRRKAWLWVALTPLVYFFQITLERSAQAAQSLLGEAFAGILGSDRYGAYTWVDPTRRQLCWAHLKRDFIQISERKGVSRTLGKALLKQQKAVFKLWYRVRDGTMSRAELREAIIPLRSRIQNLLSKGASFPIDKHKSPLNETVHTCARLLKLEPALWTFVEVDDVEPTNNQAERSLRPAVIWRRISFGSQTKAGSLFVSRMLTVVTTLRAQNRNVLDFMTQACHAHRCGISTPSLLPQQSVDSSLESPTA